nr:TetR/AcrR family transcriptional regulator [Planctomycetota bacterium]
MGRPDLTAVRTAEILDAFEQCVARFGLEGSSLERVAEEAGMKRSILRHYVGNREDLVQALAERVASRYRARFEEFREGISDRNRPAQLLDFFFPHESAETTESILVVEALIGAGSEYPTVQTLMLEYVDDLVAGT